MLIDSDSNFYETFFETATAIDNAFYGEFEMKIPASADADPNTENIVVEDAVAIDIPIGIYDYIILNPTPDDKIYIAAGGEGFAVGDNFEFEEGKVYIFSPVLSGMSDLITLTEVFAGVPASVSELTATPVDESLVCNLSWKNPATNGAGETLEELTYIIIQRNGVDIDTVKTPVIGGAETYTDNTITTDGVYTYSVYGINSEGDGAVASVSAVVGDVTIMGSVPSVTSCSTIFMDDGGSNEYNPLSEDPDNYIQIITFLPDGPNKLVKASFTEFITAEDFSADILFVIQGEYTDFEDVPDEAILAMLYGDLTENLPLTYTPETADGALTFVFVRDSWFASPGKGWTANINCVDLLDKDASIASIVSPPVSYSDSYKLSVKVKNFGTSPITSMNVNYQVAGNAPVTETFTGNVELFETADFQFTTPINVAEGTTANVKIYTTLTSEENTDNDTLEVSIKRCPFVSTLPWTMGFEDNEIPECWVQELVAGNILWTTSESNEDGYPNAAHSGTYYAVFTNTSYTPDINKLITPRLDLSGGVPAKLRFWHMQADFGGDQDKLRIYYKTSATGAWTLLEEYMESITGWTEREILLPNLSNDYYIAFEGTAMWGRGIALDDIIVEQLPATEARVVDVTVPEIGPLSESETITVTVKNAGVQPLSNIPVMCKINNNLLPVTTIAGPVASWDTIQQNITIDLSEIGEYEITVFVDLAGDADRTNDTMTTTTQSTHPAAYLWDFEQGMPNNFTMQVLDTSTANNSTIFPNNEAWATWEGGDLGYAIGQLCAVSTSWFKSGSEVANRWMITPQLTITEEALLLWAARCYEADYPDGYDVKLSTTDNNPASFTKTLFSIGGEEGEWKYRSIDLSEYKNQQIYIAFVQNTKDMNLIMVDNIKLFQKETTSITPLTSNNTPIVKIYPNPSKGMFNVIVSEKSTVRISDLQGKAIGIYTIEANSELKLNLSAGIYFVNVNSNGKISTHKAIVK